MDSGLVAFPFDPTNEGGGAKILPKEVRFFGDEK